MPQTIDRPKRTKGVPTPEGDFVVYEAVPVFDIHTGDDGVEYDEQLLQAIAANCNRRIATTGDYCPIVVAHTREQGDKKSAVDDPPVIGLAGPFYVADFVNSDGQASRAIHATFWIFPEDEKTFLRNPRRSVEIWPEERPEDRYFDPLALLGAETPKRDLGMIYSRRRSGNQPQRHQMSGPLRYSKRSVGPIRYEAGPGPTTPGESNTFIPGAGNEKKKPIQHGKGAAMDGQQFSPDQLNQLMEALKPVIQSYVDEATAVPIDTGDDLLAQDPAGAPPAAPPAPPGLDAPGGAPGLDAAGGPPGLDAPGGAAALGAGPPGGLNDGIPPEADFDDDAKGYARGLGKKFMKYKKGDSDWDDDGADKYMASMDDDDKKHLGAYMKYMCDDDGAKKRYSERYAKSPIGGTDLTEKDGDSSPSGSMDASEMKKGEPEKYSRSGSKTMEGSIQYAKVKKERDEAVQKYAKLNGEHKDLQQKYAKQEKELAELRVKERYSKRYAQLKDLETEYAFDAEEEMTFVDDFNEDQFKRHVQVVIPQRYQKYSGEMIPTGRERELKRDPENDKAQQYAKAASDAVQKYRKNGRQVEFKVVLDHMCENNGEINESTLFAHQGNGKA